MIGNRPIIPPNRVQKGRKKGRKKVKPLHKCL